MNRELSIKDLPVHGVHPTGEIGVSWMDGRWERDGQRLLCPISKLILDQQPQTSSWINAGAYVLGWSLGRTLAFKLALGRAPLSQKGNSYEASKGITDAQLYHLLYRLARKVHH
jgi:hypothetical protein